MIVMGSGDVVLTPYLVSHLLVCCLNILLVCCLNIHAGVSRNQSLRTTQLKARYELREGIQGTQRIAYSGLWAGV
jgi:hypothetical protein